MQIYSGHHKEEFIKVMVIYKGLQYLYQGYHFNFAVISKQKIENDEKYDKPISY